MRRSGRASRSPQRSATVGARRGSASAETVPLKRERPFGAAAVRERHAAVGHCAVGRRGVDGEDARVAGQAADAGAGRAGLGVDGGGERASSSTRQSSWRAGCADARGRESTSRCAICEMPGHGKPPTFRPRSPNPAGGRGPPAHAPRFASLGRMRSLARRVLMLLVVAVLAVVAVIVLFAGDTCRPRLVPGTGADNDPLAYTPGREAAFVAAAARGNAHVIYAKSPGGARASAERVARYRPLVEAAARDGRTRRRHARGDRPARERRAPGRRRRPAAGGRGRADADPRRDRPQPAAA